MRQAIDVKYQVIDKRARPPKQMTVGAGGFDLYAADMTVATNQVVYGTGIAVAIPKGYVGLLFPRSSVSKRGMKMPHSVGVIDSDYRGEVAVVYEYTDPKKLYEQGDRVAQLVVVPIPHVNFVETAELNQTKRGIGGFGSTDLQK